MGMTIDTVIQWLKIQRQNKVDFPEVGNAKKIESLDTAVSYLDDYKQLKSDYDKKLREDMSDMLIDLLSDIESLPTVRNYITDNQGATYGYTEYTPSIEDVSKLIRQKIDSLKVESEVSDNENVD